MATEHWSDDDTFVPYVKNARRWNEAGWDGVLPLAPNTKHPPPAGFTGHLGPDPTAEDIRGWIEDGLGDGNLALRLPRGVVGIDVDDYGEKHGGHTLEKLMELGGILPPTWVVTSRRPADRISGIRLFRTTEDNFPGSAGKGIEIIQHWHRYLVAPGSRHPLGPIYQLYGPDGRRTDDVPRPEDLPWLPEEWVDLLKSQVVAKEHPAETLGRPDAKIFELVGLAEFAFGVEGSRHDTMRDRMLPILKYEFLGYPGTSWALDRLHDLFVTSVTQPGAGEEVRTPEQAEAEWRRMLDGGRKLIERDPPQEATYDLVQEAMADYEQMRLGADPSVDDDPGEWSWIQASDVELKAPEQRLADRAPAVGVMQVYGMGDSGKTYLLVDAALSIEYGIDFMGRPVKQGKVGFISMERPDDLVYRARAWGMARGYEDARERLRFMRKPPLNLADQESVDRLREWVEIQGGIDVLIIDTQSKATQADENDNTVMTEVLKRASWLSDSLQCLVILVAHTGWAGTHQRGASAQQFNIDTAWKVTNDDGVFYFEVERLKAGNRAPREHFDFDRRTLTDESGKPLRDWFDREVQESSVFQLSYVALEERRTAGWADILIMAVQEIDDNASITDWRQRAQQRGVERATRDNDRWTRVLDAALATGRIEQAQIQGRRGGGQTLRPTTVRTA